MDYYLDMKKRDFKETPNSVSDKQALAMYQAVDKIMRRFKLEPGLLAGSLYADLHINDVGLLTVLSEPGDWNLSKISEELDTPDSTISSALDRLERRKLVARRRRPGDRRVIYIELTVAGGRLSRKLRAAHIENCRAMLKGLSSEDRENFIQLSTYVAQR